MVGLIGKLMGLTTIYLVFAAAFPNSAGSCACSHVSTELA